MDTILELPPTPIRGVAAHLLIETLSGEVIVDEDVNKVEVGTRVRWASWPYRERDKKVECEVRMSEVARIELTPCRDRLADRAARR